MDRMDETFPGRRRRVLDILQSEMTQREPAPVPTLPAFNATLPEGLSPYVRGLGARPPVMAGMGSMMGMQNPSRQMGTPPMTMGFGSLPLPQGGGPAPDIPSPMAANAGPAPMPPQRPMMAAPVPAQQPVAPMPPQRPEGLGSNDPMALILGYNAQAFAGDPQAVANQFTEGDMARLAARTYRNEDGSIWNDYYVK